MRGVNASAATYGRVRMTTLSILQKLENASTCDLHCADALGDEPLLLPRLDHDLAT